MMKYVELLKHLLNSYHDKENYDYTAYIELEKELKEYQQHEEILNDYGLTLVNFREACLLLAMLKGEGRNIHSTDKQLKALEIIKKNDVDMYCLRYTKSLENYNKQNEYQLTQEEYNLLKEVLK